ncbi:MAG: hypothetical protein M0Z95_01650 [Actinomycetota bacterium]|nr:hypothetical protein [Actinomycetota bacterium]
MPTTDRVHMCPTSRSGPPKRTRSAPKHYHLEVDTTLAPMLQAVSLWLGVLAHCRATDPGEVDVIPDDLTITDEQWATLCTHQSVLGLVRAAKPIVTIVECAVCGRWGLASAGPTTGKCRLTIGCSGATTKSRPAKRVVDKPPAADPVEDAGPDDGVELDEADNLAWDEPDWDD